MKLWRSFRRAQEFLMSSSSVATSKGPTAPRTAAFQVAAAVSKYGLVSYFQPCKSPFSLVFSFVLLGLDYSPNVPHLVLYTPFNALAPDLYIHDLASTSASKWRTIRRGHGLTNEIHQRDRVLHDTSYLHLDVEESWQAEQAG